MTQVTLREKLKALGNRYATDILTVLNPETGDIIPALSWEEIVDGILKQRGLVRPASKREGERTKREAGYARERRRIMAGGTLYESMSKLVDAGFVTAIGERKKKKRTFRITREGRLALLAVHVLHEITDEDTEVKRAAKTLLKYKNFVRLLPAQEKFFREVGEVKKNLMIQMPPGSGKTFLAMIIILMTMQKKERCLYLTPYLSLNRQIMDEYQDLFETLGYSIIRFDGVSNVDQEQLENADLVVAIIESFLQAKLKGDKWTETIGLAVIDEITELNSSIDRVNAYNLGSDRSTRLDVLITLLKQDTHIITLSSRFGETERVCKWLDAQTFRPMARIVPDEYVVEMEQNGVRIISSDNSHNIRLEQQDPLEAVIEHLGPLRDKAVLIVVGTRARAENMAKFMAENHPREIGIEEVKRVISVNEDTPAAARLFEVLEHGIAFHHAGLSPEIRGRLERLIKRKIVKTVVATTGITAGVSFPFDTVILLVDRYLVTRITRAKYLQIAGRIGEYHLVRNGGSVYLILEEPTAEFPDTSALAERLFHEPLQPLLPGEIYPSLLVSIIERFMTQRRYQDVTRVTDDVNKFIADTLRSTHDPEYADRVSKQIVKLMRWLDTNEVLVQKQKRLQLSNEAKDVIGVGLNLLEFVRNRDAIFSLTASNTEQDVIDCALMFGQPQSIRPRTLLPSQFEIELMGIDTPDEHYLEKVRALNEIKRQVLLDWINEKTIGEIVSTARASKASIDEGDLQMFVNFCSGIIGRLGLFFKGRKQRDLAARLHIFSKRLRYGVQGDLADTDLFDLPISTDGGRTTRVLSREEARVLIDHGYRSIADIVRRDVDHTKRGTARTRFAKNSGLEKSTALTIYKSALEYYRKQRGTGE